MIGGRSTEAASGQRGQALVEFALVIPLFLFLLVASLQFALLVMGKNAVVNAAELGARVAAIHGAEPTANDQICAAIQAGLHNNGVDLRGLGQVVIFRGTHEELNSTATDNSLGAHDVGTCVRRDLGLPARCYSPVSLLRPLRG